MTNVWRRLRVFRCMATVPLRLAGFGVYARKHCCVLFSAFRVHAKNFARSQKWTKVDRSAQA